LVGTGSACDLLADVEKAADPAKRAVRAATGRATDKRVDCIFNDAVDVVEGREGEDYDDGGGDGRAGLGLVKYRVWEKGKLPRSRWPIRTR
jgi:hypothetical protein